MQAALYFPHTEVRSEALLRSALMTWDKLEYIAPRSDFRPSYKNPQMQKIIELIGEARAPSAAEQNEVHNHLVAMLQHGVPETFSYSPVLARQDRTYEERVYELWPEKFADMTWDLLRQAGVAGSILANGDYPASEAGGLTIMSVLADVMAGETRARITDRGRAYATIANVANRTAQPAAPVYGEDFEAVVALTLRVPDLSNVPFERLIKFRENERGSRGPEYRALRHSYLAAVEAHMTALSGATKPSDRQLLNNQFETRMSDDFKELKAELGLVRNAAWLSKDVIVLALAGVGAGIALAAAAPITIPAAITAAGLPATLGGVLSAANRFSQDRRATLRKHPMAYVYELEP